MNDFRKTEFLFYLEKIIFCTLFVYSSGALYTQVKEVSDLTSSFLVALNIVMLLTIAFFLASSMKPKEFNLSIKSILGVILFSSSFLIGFESSKITTNGYVFIIFYFFKVMSLLLLIVSYLSLGNNMGVIPAKREITYKWSYQYLKHPIYSFWIFIVILITIEYPTLKNIISSLLLTLGFYLKAIEEERVLSSDSQYKKYSLEKKYLLFHPVMVSILLLLLVFKLLN